MVWGTDRWRFDGDSVQSVGKAVDFGAVTLADAPTKDIGHLDDMGSTLLSDSITATFSRTISDQIATAFEITNALFNR